MKKKLTLLIALSIMIAYVMAPITVVANEVPEESYDIVITEPQKPVYILPIEDVEEEIVEETVELLTIDEVVQEINKGLWGNGEERKNKLIEAGYDYEEVQKKLSELIINNPVNKPAAAINQTEMMNYVWNLMRAKGWSENLCAGILGNMIAESGVRPDAIGDRGRSYGLCQWNGARRRTLETVYGISVEGQINFLAYELESYPEILYSTKSCEEIAYDFCVKFERPSNKYSKAEKRKALATGVYNTFVNK